MLYTVCLALFLIITGLSQLGLTIPNWMMILCGVCGVAAGAILLIGLF